MTNDQPNEHDTPKRRKGIYPFLIAVVIFIIAWILIRPGVFTVQPIGAIPGGITVVYHSRNPEMPFFSSPDGLCLDLNGSVTLLCRMAALSAMDELADRIILRLPYSRFAYLQSTGGLEFDR